MKAFISIVLAVLFVFTAKLSQIKGYGQDALLNHLFGQCSEKNNITKEAILSIVNHDHVPDDGEVKIKEGKIDWEHCRRLSKYGLNDEEDKAKVDQMVEICKVKVPQEENDVCQLAYSAAVCNINYWKEMNNDEQNEIKFHT